SRAPRGPHRLSRVPMPAAPTPGSGPAANMQTPGDDETEVLHAPVPEHLAGRRFDQALAAMFPEFSRSRLTEWIRTGAALLDGAPARPRDPVHAGQVVAVAVERTQETAA